MGVRTLRVRVGDVGLLVAVGEEKVSSGEEVLVPVEI